MPLQLEVNASICDPKPFGERVLITPPIGEDFWMFRVKLDKKGQAIVGFPKFGTIGIGFAKEEDWNTNLPYKCESVGIYNHIKHNKGNKSIPKERCIAAIRMVQEAARKARGN